MASAPRRRPPPNSGSLRLYEPFGAVARKTRTACVVLATSLLVLGIASCSGPKERATEVHMPPPYLIAGTVRDPSGSPVPQASVYLTDGPVPWPDSAALTDDTGTFTLTVSAPGTYTVEARAAGFTAQAAAVNVTGGPTSQLEIRLRR
jgi:hypothetical protein